SNSTTADEKKRIESYLALKYGITLKNSNGSRKDYVSSLNTDTDTDVAIWTASQNVGYGHRITGIGRDNASALYQKQSKSQEADALVTIAIGESVEASNAANEGAIANLRFFTFSDNNASALYTDAIVETGTHNIHRMKRTFKVQKTADWSD